MLPSPLVRNDNNDLKPPRLNTVPLATLEAFRDHGVAAGTLTEGVVEAAAWLETLNRERLTDLDELGEWLQQAGLAQFEVAFFSMLQTVGIAIKCA